jgi:hypothetical protein
LRLFAAAFLFGCALPNAVKAEPAARQDAAVKPETSTTTASHKSFDKSDPHHWRLSPSAKAVRGAAPPANWPSQNAPEKKNKNGEAQR